MMRLLVPEHLYEHVAVEVGGILGVEASSCPRLESASFEEAFSLRVWNGHCRVEVLRCSQKLMSKELIVSKRVMFNISVRASL